MNERLAQKLMDLTEAGERYRDSRTMVIHVTEQMESLAVELVLEGISKAEVARRAGVSLATIDGWIAAREGD